MSCTVFTWSGTIACSSRDVMLKFKCAFCTCTQKYYRSNEIVVIHFNSLQISVHCQTNKHSSKTCIESPLIGAIIYLVLNKPWHFTTVVQTQNHHFTSSLQINKFMYMYQPLTLKSPLALNAIDLTLCIGAVSTDLTYQSIATQIFLLLSRSKTKNCLKKRQVLKTKLWNYKNSWQLQCTF